jgi:hypothetical protein
MVAHVGRDSGLGFAGKKEIDKLFASDPGAEHQILRTDTF